MNMSYYKLNVNCWSYNTAVTACFCFALIFKVSTPPPPPPRPVALPREICTECFERLVSNILQGDKMLHFLYIFVYILILISLTKGSICYYWNQNGLDGRITRPNC
jgi:hypothetical protein